jgi:ABC-type branched-subunit amino acid transport system substrate-binding protein
MIKASARRHRLRLGACLSLTGKFARFGHQAAAALRVWQSMEGNIDLAIEDDESDPRIVKRLLSWIADRSDVLLGPYATNLTRAASNVAADNGWLLWNHGGSGDDIESAHPGNLVSILTPTSRYAEPFIKHLSAANNAPPSLVIARGGGAFGRQVAAGAATTSRESRIHVIELEPDQGLPHTKDSWALFSTGTFEDDTANVRRAQTMTNPPSIIGSVAAGVREFGDTIDRPRDILGIAQWFPGAAQARPNLGPTEQDFLAAYAATGQPIPDYPAVQAVAAAVLSTHCARLAGSTARTAVWEAAASLDTTTLFGNFKIDPTTGAQVAHQTVLLRWTAAGPNASTTARSHPALVKPYTDGPG